MPPEAKVAVIEDSMRWQQNYGRILPSGGHSVVATATTFEAAMELVPTLSEQRVQVVILDGNLSEDRSDGIEGAMLAREIRLAHPDIKIVGISNDDRGVRGAHKNVWKGDLVPNELNDLITKL